MPTLFTCTSAKSARTLIADGADVNEKSMTGETPLHRAVYEGRTAIVKVLIDARADVNARNRIGCTPLHNAAFSGFIGAERAKIAWMLIAAGADPTIRDNRGDTPADICTPKDFHIFARESASN